MTWAGVRRDLHQVEALLARDAQRRVQAEHAKLVLLIVDQTHLLGADLLVDALLPKRYEPLPRSSSVLSDTSYKQNDGQPKKPSALTNLFKRLLSR